MKKWLTWILLLAVIGGGVAFWLYKRAHRESEIPYKTAPVERRTVVARVTSSGTLQARVTVQVGSQVSGRVQQLFADFNSAVKKGQVVAKLDPQLFEASVAQANAAFKSAQANVAKAQAQAMDADRNYERAKAQRQQGVASQQEVDTAQTAAAVAKATVDAAKSAADQARAQLNQDQVNLSLTTIKSPIDGVVISRSVDVGQTVAASLQAPVLFTIAEDLTKMQVETSVPESDVGRLEVGMAATFNVDAFPGRRFKGTIEQVRNAATTVQNVVTYTAIIGVDNADLKLRPGMTANVTIVSGQKDNVLVVPNTALRFKPSTTSGSRSRPSGGPAASGSAGAPRAWGGAQSRSGNPDEGETKVVYLPDGVNVKPVRIRTGLTDGSYTELLDGALHDGQQVVVEALATAAGASTPQGGGALGGRPPRGPF
jgi:HlyD family secretion protein